MMSENNHFINMVMDPSKMICTKDEVNQFFLEVPEEADCVPMGYSDEWQTAAQLTAEELDLGEEFLDNSVSINEYHTISNTPYSNLSPVSPDGPFDMQNYQQIKAGAYKATDFFTDFMFGNCDTLPTETDYKPTKKRKLITHTGLGPLEQKRTKYEKKSKSTKTQKVKTSKYKNTKTNTKANTSDDTDTSPAKALKILTDTDINSPDPLSPGKLKQTSKFRGVSCCGKDRKWQARIRDSNRVRYLGRFQTEVEAALVYDEAARQCKGERAPTNFISMNAETLENLKRAFAATGGIPEHMKYLMATRRKGRKKKSKTRLEVEAPIVSTPQHIKGKNISSMTASPKATKKPNQTDIKPLKPRPMISNVAAQFWSGNDSSKIVNKKTAIPCI